MFLACVLTLLRVWITELTVAARVFIIRVTNLDAHIVVAAQTILAPVVISATRQTEASAIPEVAISVVWAIIVTATEQVDALMGIRVTHLTVLAAARFVESAAILAAAIGLRAISSDIGTTVRVFDAVDTTRVRATIGCSFKSHATIGLAGCL
tara:strand:- start:15 stop:473 length:459 start_codon:yes stop_codon:yes gene_type:complete